MTFEEINNLTNEQINEMSSREVLNALKGLTRKEIEALDFKTLTSMIKRLSVEEKMELSDAVGYHVYNRLCMGDLKHDFVLKQNGSAAIIVNSEGQILMQSRADNDRWGLPGGCQEVRESFEDTIIREIKEETNLDVKKEDLELISIVSGMSRYNSYPNGDVVINNTVLYCVRNYSGELKWNEESKKMAFFDLDNLPSVQNDPDLIERYKEYLSNKKRI